MVARDQLRAFVERVERIEERLEYVLSALRPCRGISPGAMNRAFNLASAILGVEYVVGKRILQLADAGRADLALPWVGPLDAGLVGHVYWARSERFPNLVKIGFSTDVPKRIAVLSQKYRAPMEVVRTKEGTMLDEHAEHCRLAECRQFGEWFKEAA